jgi:eukaryotic-like serine/threonine-protein kinase
MALCQGLAGTAARHDALSTLATTGLFFSTWRFLMNATSFGRLKQVFNAAIELPPDERGAYLRAQRDLGANTRAQIEDLLRSDAQVHAASTRRATAGHATQESGDWSGRVIGAYRIERPLGHGGMGSVFLAQRADGSVAQNVAIKVIRAELPDETTLARFRLERQVLALLQHPNIAPLLDLGELPDGSPYIVMAYVEGRPIDRYAEETQLDLHGCLRLFLQICDAIAYGHRNLIVHRDLKPNNVLVDGEGRPQLIDFGIAKPLASQIGTIDIERTEDDQRFLSLSHAAPEQLAGAPVTTACDVYGLGVLLYELLGGRPPFYRAGQTPAQLAARIASEDPLPPSSTRDAESSRFRIPRDLDLIVLRCLRKQPADRYASVDQLGDDIRRYLDGRPVLARRGNVLYRVSRFVRRHRVAVAAVAVLATAATFGGAIHLRQQSALAREQRRADDMTGLITEVLRSVDPASADKGDISAREIFERVAVQAQESPNLSAASRTNILGAVIRIQLGLGLPKQAEKLLEMLDLPAVDTQQRRELRLLQAQALNVLTRYDDAAVVIRQGLVDEPDGSTYNGEYQQLDAAVDYGQGRYSDALKKLDAMPREGLPAELDVRRGILRSNTLWVLGRPEDSIAEVQKVYDVQRQRLGDKAPATYHALQILARRVAMSGDIEKSSALKDQLLARAESTISANSIRYADTLTIASLIESERKNYAKAIDYEKQAVNIFIAQLGAVNERATSSYLNIAEMYEWSGDMRSAEAHYIKAVKLGEQQWRAEDPNLLYFRLMASGFLANYGNCAAAKEFASRSLADMETHSFLKEYDGAVLLQAVDDYCDFVATQNPDNRTALAKSLQYANSVGESPAVKSAISRLVEKSRALGVELAP